MAERARVVLYARPGCILCAQVKKQLDAAGVRFDEVIVGDQSAQAQLLERSGSVGFPALFVDGRYVGGFSHVVYLLTEGRLQALVDRARDG